MARRALQDKKEHESRAHYLKVHYGDAKANADSLRDRLRKMKDEFANMQNRKDVLVARAETAKAQKQINQAMSGFGKKSAKNDFDRMSEKILQLEAEAETSKELKRRDPSLDDELNALGNDGVEDELTVLKAKLERKEG